VTERTATELAAYHLRELCLRYPDRHVGGPGNAEANDFFGRVVAGYELEVERMRFACVDWKPGGASLEAGGRDFDVCPGAYSLPVDVTAPLALASTLDELEAIDARGAVLLLHGQIAAEQLTPKRYPFYSWDSHTRILEALEAAGPAAVVAATGKDSGLTAALYPFPLFEDGDFDIPSAYMKDVDAEQLLARAGELVHLAVRSQRLEAFAEQLVVFVPGRSKRRVVVSAHIDSRHGTPGALDNAASVAVLLALAALLRDEPPAYTLELVPFNGEDNYAAPGEVAYFSANEGLLGDIVCNVNMDAAGCAGKRTAVSFYGCPEEITATATRLVGEREGFMLGEPWPASDHSIFAMRGVPAIAITSENLLEIGSTVAHTAEDLPELVDPEIIVEIAHFLRELIEAL